MSSLAPLLPIVFAMNRSLRYALPVLSLSFVAFMGCATRPTPSLLPRAGGPAGIPMPTEHYQDEGAEKSHKRERKAWIREQHRAAPDLDWKAQERRNGEAEMARRQLLSTASTSARWTEVGSRNQAGRMHCAALGPDGPDGRRLYGGSALGGLWRALPDGTSWEPLGDNLYGGVRQLVPLPGELAGEEDVVLVATGEQEVFVTRDLGLTWEAPAGLPALSGVLGVARLEDGANTLLVYARHGSSTSLFASVDYGRTFAQRWSGSQSWAGGMWVPRKGAAAATDVYLLHRGRLRRSTDAGQSFTQLSTLDTSASQGRLCGSEAGSPTLYASLVVGGTWELRRSDDGGFTWTSPTSIPDNWGAMNASTIDPLRVCYGGVDAQRSTDGGVTFTKINSWGDYYGDPMHKLHADIQGIYCWPDPTDVSGWDIWYFCTDGGIFLSTDLTASVINRSVDGLGVSQYYSTHTSVNNSDLIVAGSQDQGYQRGFLAASTGSGPSTSFDQLISGDYGHLTSSDGTHDLLYSTYPGFILVQQGENNPNLLYPFVDFPAGASHLWLPPVVADPLDKNSFFFLGDRLWRYTRASGVVWNDVLHSGQTFTAGGGNYLSALAFAPSNPNRAYAVNDAGVAYSSSDHGSSWSQLSLAGPDSHYFYGSTIAVHPGTEHEVFIGGSGYSNPGVYRSTDGGQSWQPMANGLPSTLVHDLAYAADGSGDVFAATDAGVYRWHRSDLTWTNELDPGTPITQYWSVEAVPGQPVMRFGTYGRGIWDLDLSPLTGGSWELYGQGASTANFLALDSSTPPNIGSQILFQVTGAGHGGAGYLMAGRVQASTPFFDGVQLVGQVVRTLPLNFSSTGDATRVITLPMNPALVGLDFYFQAVAPDNFLPQGWALSNGLKAIIGL